MPLILEHTHTLWGSLKVHLQRVNLRCVCQQLAVMKQREREREGKKKTSAFFRRKSEVTARRWLTLAALKWVVFIGIRSILTAELMVSGHIELTVDFFVLISSKQLIASFAELFFFASHKRREGKNRLDSAKTGFILKRLIKIYSLCFFCFIF